jgi:hypothetical protein
MSKHAESSPFAQFSQKFALMIATPLPAATASVRAEALGFARFFSRLAGSGAGTVAKVHRFGDSSFRVRLIKSGLLDRLLIVAKCN